MIAITDVRLEADDAGQTLSGCVDGKNVWFRFPANVAVEARGEPFLTYALFLGKTRAEDISVDPSAPLSARLLERLSLIQAILQQWNPDFTRVRISATARPIAQGNPGVLSTFSGGVDSLSTLEEHLGEITHLLTLSNFDEGGGPQSFEELKAKMEQVADEFGKTLVPVETNARDLCRDWDLGWTYVHGPLLCLLGSALGFDRLYMAASYTYRELQPWGTHLVLDPFWSNETTEIIHDGAHLRRSEKTARIARDPALLKHLQVCWKSKTENCGRCSKCARTLLVLNMLGGRHRPFPDIRSEELASLLKADSTLSAVFVWDVMRLAEERKELKIAALLRRRLIRFSMVQHFRMFRRAARQYAEEAIGSGMVARLRGRRPTNPRPRALLRDPTALH